MSLNLTPEEIAEITATTQKAAQVRRLRLMGFTVCVRADGAPIVSRQHYQLKMGGLDTQTAREVKGPDLDALREYLQ